MVCLCYKIAIDKKWGAHVYYSPLKCLKQHKRDTSVAQAAFHLTKLKMGRWPFVREHIALSILLMYP